jgi:FAD/FMN-containing dehydrogenase
MRAVLLLLYAAAAGAEVVDDVTRLNPVAVAWVARPRSVEEVRRLVAAHAGPVSIGGGRYSMGGQTAAEGALQLDMRGMDRVLLLDAEKKLAKVEAGITWRKLQETLSPQGLSVKIMQSYASFTVGGSLGVNCHGRYVNQGPLIRSVRELEVVLADGSLVAASPTKNKEVFNSVIGGLGGVGVVVTATLELEDDERVERTSVRLPVNEYLRWFQGSVRGSKKAVDTVDAVTYSRTDKPATVAAKLQPPFRSPLKTALGVWALSNIPGAKAVRRWYNWPALHVKNPVYWRNWEASYEVATLEPWSRRRSTFVLQEYFVPAERFYDFFPRMTEIFKRRRANVLNVSIRHALPDTGSVLAWARGETFAFVVYHEQGTTEEARAAVGEWTRELIDAALAAGGTYYLPYQPHATEHQFRRAYPRVSEWAALKKRLDPSHKFRSKFWDKYLPPPRDEIAEKLAARPGYRRPEDQTFLTLPEWSIVFAADDYAAYLKKGGLPSAYPHGSEVRQFWTMYSAVRRAASGYPTNWDWHATIWTIGLSFTVESWTRGLYEGVVGRLAERLSSGALVPEEAWRTGFEADYGRFMHDLPWYEFPFGARLREFRAVKGGASARSLERRLAVTAELGAKALYGKLIKKATGAAFGAESLTIGVRLSQGCAEAAKVPGVKLEESFGARGCLVSMPRYEKFQAALAAVAAKGGRLVEIAGNRTILMTATAPRAWDGARLRGAELGRWRVPARPETVRVAVAVPVSGLAAAVRELPKEGAEVEHVFDY